MLRGMTMPLSDPAAAAAGPLFIVLNAGSGHRDAGSTQQTIAGLLDEAGREHEFLLIDDPARIAQIAARAVRLARERRGVVVAAGGDGTINAVAQAVLGSGCPFGVLPQGTFNYFGRVHGIPQDTEAATRALLRAQVEPVQVGLVNERVFLVNASLGLYPQLLEDREAWKQQFGRSRLVAALSAIATVLRERRQLRLDVETRGQSLSLRTPTLFVGNNPLQLERLGLPQAEALERGQLAAIAIRPVGTLAMFWLALRGALGRLGEADNLRCVTCRKLTVRPRGHRRIKVATDGEIAWMQTPLRFEVAEQQLPLLVPRPEDRAEIA